MIECAVMITVSSISSALHVGGFARPLTASVWLLMLRVIGGASLVAAAVVSRTTPSIAEMTTAVGRAMLIILLLVIYSELTTLGT